MRTNTRAPSKAKAKAGTAFLAARPGPWRLALVLLALGVLLTGPFVGISPLAQSSGDGGEDSVDPTRLQWWGDTAIGNGFHLRVPVTVQNNADHPVTNGAVLVEVDITEKLQEAGWVTERTSTGELLRVFQFDPDSVRVVAMNDLLPQDPRNPIHGRLAFHDGGAEGIQRHVVPSTHFTGSTTSSAFHERTNPMITVLWHVHQELAPGERAHYVIYFDSLTNQHGHPPPDHSRLAGSAILERTFWNGPGTDLVGLIADGDTVVHLIGLHDETEVEIRRANTAGRFPSTSVIETLTLNRHEFQQVTIGQTSGQAFRVLASHPVLALVNSEGYVPTAQGTLEGHEFLFTTTYRADQATQDSLFFLTRGPTQEAVQIELERLNAAGVVQESETIDINQGDNQFPYTIGAHGGAGTVTRVDNRCEFPSDEGGVVQLTPGREHYRARVIEGGPVSLQLQPTRGVTQVPGIDGAPMATDFWTAFSRTEASGANCARSSDLYRLYGASTQETDLFIHSPEANPPDAPIFECSRGDCSGDLLGPVPASGFQGQGEINTIQGIFDRLLNFRTTDPAWLMVGEPRDFSLSDIPLRGPLGGADAGRHFVGIGPTQVYPLFPGTRIDATIHYNFGDSLETRLTFVADQVSRLPAPPGATIQWYELNSNRPIVVMPERASPGFLAGMPLMLDATVHQADYRGYLVELTTPRGDKDHRGLTGPGQEIEYPLVVTNLGRNAHGEPLVDRFDLVVTDVPEGWTATFDGQSQRVTRDLRTGESQQITLTVTPDSDMSSGSSSNIRVQAISRGAENLGTDVRDSVRTFTRIETNVNVDLWALDPDGDQRKIYTGRIAMNEMYNHTLLVENKGTIRDTFEINFLNPVEPGWEVFLLQGGQEAGAVTLDPGQSTTLTFQVIPPRDQQAIFMPMNMEARSTTDTTVSSLVLVQTQVTAPSDLFLEALEPMQWIQAGAEALFPVIIGNKADGAARVFLDMQVDELRDWTPPTVFAEEPSFDGTRLERHPVSEENVHPHSQLTRWVNVTAPENAVAGDRIVLRLQAQVDGQDHAIDEFFVAQVEPTHRVRVDPPPLPLHARGGEPLEVDLWLTNDGNLDEILRPIVTDLPSGWRLSFDREELLINRNDTIEGPDLSTIRLGLQIEAPHGVEDGDYDLAFDLLSREGNRTPVTLPVRVGVFIDHDVTGPELIQGQPGRTAWAEYRVKNQGNVPMHVELQRLDADEEPWDLAQLGTTRVLPPGADAVIQVGWEVPRDATDGTSTHQAMLNLRPDHPDVEAIPHTVQTTIEIDRADLYIAEATAHPSPAGHIIRAIIGNQGERSAHDVTIQLRVGTTTVDQVRIGEIAPGTTRNLTLLQPSGHEGQATIVVNPDGNVVESDSTNNMLGIDEDAERQESPGFPALLVLLCMILLAGTGRRRNRLHRDGSRGIV